ncbi:MAG: NosD domain-containing protein [Candidatus Thermoplasmatota archaeon]|nr:NosD domain-containing protein [Candidatus Thermoplasmatota archaeon]
MSSKIARIIALSACLLLALGPFGTTGTQGDAEYPVRAQGEVIIINSDTELEEEAFDNGWTGDGSEGNPFIIEDLEINGSGYDSSIYIGNTTHHFIIRDCTLFGVEYASELPAGMILLNVSRGRVENVTCRDNGNSTGVGIWLLNSGNVTITGSTFANNGDGGEASVGIYLLRSSNITVTDSVFFSDVGADICYGIYAEGSREIHLSGLMMKNNTGVGEGGGIYLDRVEDFIIDNCLMQNNSGDKSSGIYMDGSGRINVKNCTILGNQFSHQSYGIFMDNAHNCIIEGNVIKEQNRGLHMLDSNENRIMNNHFEDHVYGFFLHLSDDNWIEGNTILETDYANFGSCPFLYTWNGEQMELIGDVNGMGGLGYSFDMTVNGGASFERRPPTSIDYTAIDASSMKAVDGNYVLELVEEQDEITYFDEAELWVIDHSSDVEIYNPEAALCSFEQDLFTPVVHTVKDPFPPVSATDWNGNDILDVISDKDGIYTKAELLNDNYVTLDLGDLSGAPQIKLVYSAYTDWSPLGTLKENSYAEVVNSEGNWEMVTIDDHLGKPEALPRTWVMDITGWFKTDDHRLRLHTGNIKIHIDQIAIDTSLDEPVDISIIEPSEAEHFFKGPLHPTFESFEGDFTRYGDVLPLVEETDDMFVVMKDGDAVRLKFPEQAPPSHDRDFWLVTDAYFKQPFLKYILGQSDSSVYPLPFHAMSNYPYSCGETYPTDPEHVTYIEEWNTRRVESVQGGGMSLPSSDNNTVIRNIFNGSSNSYMIQIVDETNCSIIENEIISGGTGIRLINSLHVLIKDNIICNMTKHGISISRSGLVEVEGNRILKNHMTGLHSSNGHNVTVYNNYFDNELNWNLSNTRDFIWNVSLREGGNILGGSLIGGNFWNNYTGDDLNGDMIGDTMVPFGPGDHLPLTYEDVRPEISDATTGDPTTGDPFVFTAEASDLGGIENVFIEFWFDDGTHDNWTMAGSGPFIETVPMPDSVLDVYYFFSALDVSGNWERTDILEREVMDNDRPEFQNITYTTPAGVSDPIPVSMRITDNIRVDNVTMTYEVPDEMNGINLTYANEGDLYNVTVPGLSDIGWVNLSIVAVDEAGNHNFTMVTVYIIDDGPPTIEILNPTNGSYVSGMAFVALNVLDEISGIDMVTVNVSGTEIYNATPDGSEFVIPWNTTEFDDGAHTIVVSAWDGSGNMEVVSIEVLVKNNFTPEEELDIIFYLPHWMAVDIPVDVVVEVTFSVPVDIDTVFITATGMPSFELSWESNDTVMKMTFSENLAYSRLYTIWVDSAFSKIAAPLSDTPFELSFTTVSNTTDDDDDDDTTDDDIADDDDDDDDTKDNGSLTVVGVLFGVIILILLVIIAIIIIRRSQRGSDIEE